MAYIYICVWYLKHLSSLQILLVVSTKLKKCSSTWVHLPQFSGEHNKSFKPPPSQPFLLTIPMDPSWGYDMIPTIKSINQRFFFFYSQNTYFPPVFYVGLPNKIFHESRDTNLASHPTDSASHALRRWWSHCLGGWVVPKNRKMKKGGKNIPVLILL